MRRMDDVEDNSELRRGKPVAHAIYGIPQTINTANYVYFLAMQELLATGGPGGAEMQLVTGEFFPYYLLPRMTRADTSEELLNLHRGQGMDLFWRDSLTCPTEEEYVQMVLGSECSGVHFARNGADMIRDRWTVQNSSQAHDGEVTI